jgi:hypothetical protein
VGALRQPVRGAYLDARTPDDLASRAACLKLRLPAGAVVGRVTPAWLWGVDGRSPDERAAPLLVDCIVPPGRQPLRRPGVRGIARARRLADLVEPRTESMGESWLRLRIVDAGFPRPVVQIEVLDADGRCVYRLDLGWEDERVAVEDDGEEYHSTPEQLARDRRRREDLERTDGWRVLAVGKGEVLGASLALEKAVGELLGREPQIRRRSW